jgi:hypothetical protein
MNRTAPDPAGAARPRRATLDDMESVARLHRLAFFHAMPHMPVLHTPAEDLAFFYERHGFRAERETDGARNEEWQPDVLYRWTRPNRDERLSETTISGRPAGRRPDLAELGPLVDAALAEYGLTANAMIPRPSRRRSRQSPWSKCIRP